MYLDDQGNFAKIIHLDHISNRVTFKINGEGQALVWEYGDFIKQFHRMGK